MIWAKLFLVSLLAVDCNFFCILCLQIKQKGVNLPSHYKSSAVLQFHAKIAQLVERDLAKVEVAGSSPVFRSTTYTLGW